MVTDDHGIADSERAEPILVSKIDLLRIEDGNGWYRRVRIDFALRKPLKRGQRVRISYGFDKKGRARELVGEPTLTRILTKKFDVALYLYTLEQDVAVVP